jgi:hypothetical protein
LSGDLLGARWKSTGIEFRYSSPGRAVILLNQRPREVFVDDRRVEAPLEQAGGGNWAVVLPRGEHRAVVETATRAGVLLNLWGWISASAIAAFGALTAALMIGIYLRIRLRRLVRRGGAT